MADISAIKLPNGTTYNLKDSISGYTTNTGTITQVQTTAGAHTTINVSSGAATFNVPTKTSHLTNDSGFITASHTSTYSLPTAVYNTLGGIKPAYSTTGTATLTTSSQAYTNSPTIAARTTTSGKYYGIEIDSTGRLFVNVPWADTKVTTAALTSGTLYYPILATGTGTATRQIDSTLKGLTYKSTAGTTSTVGSALLVLGNDIAQGTTNNEEGQLALYGPSGKYEMIVCDPSANRILELPDQTGILATTKDIYESVSLTQAEYDALPLTDKNDSKKIYYITDSSPTPTVNEMLNTFYPIGTCYETYNSSFDPTSEWGGDWTVEEINDDEVVEEGQSDRWTYRKWKSGLAEAYGTKASQSYAMTSSSGNGYYASGSTTIPSGIFNAVTSATANRVSGGGLVFISITGLSTTSISYYVCCTTSMTSSFTILHTVQGTWKTYVEPTTMYRWKRVS